MEVKITNTEVQVLGDNSIGFEQDNLMNRLSVITDRGSQWKYSLLVFMVSNNKANIISLARDSDTELHVEFTKEMLPVNGRYIMQFEYTNGNIVGHTDKFDAYVKDVINLEDTWVGVPSEFEQLRQEVMQNATIAQNAANEAEQISQEIKVEVDKAVEAANKSQQNAQQVEQAVKLAQEAQRLAQQASEVAQSAKDEAVLASNEAEHSAAQASQSKLEASQSATQASVSKDEAKKAQLASEKARDESQTILEQIRGIKTEVDGIVAQINEARDKALQAIEANKNSAVESVDNAGATNVSNVNQAGATQAKAVNDAGAKQVLAITAEGSKQVGLVSTAGQEQVKSVNDSGAIQTANAKEQADRAKTEADRAELVVANKLDKPTTTPAVNQILKVKSVNPDGSFMVTWADDGGGTVQDVRVNGSTVVQDGVADIPMAGTDKMGVVALPPSTYGIGIGDRNRLALFGLTEAQIKERYGGRPLMGVHIDTAVRIAMCDGKGKAWTAEEQAAARDRMGLSGAKLIADITLESDVAVIKIAEKIAITEYTLFMRAPKSSVAVSTYLSRTIKLADGYRDYGKTLLIYNVVNTDRETIAYAQAGLSNGLERTDFMVSKFDFAGSQVQVSNAAQYGASLTGSYYTDIGLSSTRTDVKFPVGTRIQLYGK